MSIWPPPPDLESLKELFAAADIEGLIDDECPLDEYDPEARHFYEATLGLPASGLKSEKKEGLRVHGRTGQPCPVCGDTVRQVSFATKSLQYCATCQTGGKPLADRRLSRLLK